MKEKYLYLHQPEMNTLSITFLGTGTSQGVPVIACNCRVCTSADPRDNRLRTSLLVAKAHTVFAIDSGPDFRQQMLNNKVQQLDAIVFTHEHKDHVAGMDDVRAYNYLQQKPMDVYATVRVQQALHREFHYVFNGDDYPGIPQVMLHSIDKDTCFTVGDVEITPVEVMHYKLPVLGFRISNFAYITDAKTIADVEIEKLRGVKVLVLNALRRNPHISHFTLSEAIEMAQNIGAETTYLTHISHYMGTHTETEELLPPGIHLAYDGLQITV
jgi:phosphoribosyl 1,2-cyclic phosphate phosphodiesterase